jgi:hypothetical protein
MQFSDFSSASEFQKNVNDFLKGTIYKNGAVFAWVQISSINPQGYDIDMAVYNDELPSGKTPEIAKVEVLKLLSDKFNEFSPAFVLAHPSGRISPRNVPAYSQMVIQ